VPIRGTKRVNYLEENVGAMNVALTPDDVARIDTVSRSALPPVNATRTWERSIADPISVSVS